MACFVFLKSFRTDFIFDRHIGFIYLFFQSLQEEVIILLLIHILAFVQML